MSETIQTERYTRGFHSALYCQRVGDIIDVDGDNRVATVYPSALDIFDFGQPKRRVHVAVGLGGIEKRAITAATAESVFLMVNECYSTDDLGVVRNIETVNRVNADWLWSDATGWCHWPTPDKNIQKRTESANALSSAAKLRVERLSAIQAAMGLPVQTLADVLRISRPGLYKWLDAKQDITLQADNRQRLALIEQLAKRWREKSNAPLNSIAHEPLANGHTVLEMLTNENVGEAPVVSAFNELVAKLQSKPKSLSQRMVDAGFKRRPSHRSLPADE